MRVGLWIGPVAVKGVNPMPSADSVVEPPDEGTENVGSPLASGLVAKGSEGDRHAGRRNQPSRRSPCTTAQINPGSEVAPNLTGRAPYTLRGGESMPRRQPAVDSGSPGDQVAVGRPVADARRPKAPRSCAPKARRNSAAEPPKGAAIEPMTASQRLRRDDFRRETTRRPRRRSRHK